MTRKNAFSFAIRLARPVVAACVVIALFTRVSIAEEMQPQFKAIRLRAPASTDSAVQAPDVASRATGLTIIAQFDSTILNDPRAADIQATINGLIATYKANFSDPVTVTILFQNMSSGLGQSSTYIHTLSYSSYRTALIAKATSADDQAALQNVPAGTANPVNGSTSVDVTTALGRALGFSSNPPAGQPDSTIGVNAALTNILATDNSANKYSMAAVLSHEIDEALGIDTALNGLSNGAAAPTGAIAAEDLFRFAAGGARSFNTAQNTAAYFSIDGVTDLARYNQTAGGDFSDWYSPGGQTPQVQDAFGTSGSKPVLGVELRVLDVIGYTRTTVPVSQPNLAPVTPAGWSDSIVVSKVTGTTTDDTGLLTTDTLFVDFAFGNLRQTTAAGAAFTTQLFVDNTLVKTVSQAAGLGFNSVQTLDVNIGSLTAGTHSITMKIDTGATVAESNESDNIYSKSISVTAPVTPLPNLAPVTPAGWSDSIVIAKSAGTTTDATGLLTTDTLFVDFAFGNLSQTVAAGAAFDVQLLVDNTVVKTVTQAAGLGFNSTQTLSVNIGSLAAGSHTISMSIDVTNSVAESNEADNIYTRSISVAAPNTGLPNLAPFKPSQWSDSIVVSRVTGTNTDDVALLPTDTLYVDFAYANFSQTVATNAAFSTQLLVDNVVVKTVTQNAGLGFFYITTQDVNIGSLAGGQHTISMKIDSGNTVAESNESDNVFTKTITVAGLNNAINLTIDSNTAIVAPTVTSVGSAITVSSGVLNNGTAAAGSFVVRYRLSTDTTYSPATDVLLGDATINSLAAGSVTVAAFTGTVPAIPAGNYYLVWTIDVLGQVVESNENDNVFYAPNQIAIGTGTGTPNTPPVITSAPSFSPASPVAGAPVAFSVAASDAENDTLTYAWDFGDGGVGSGTAPSHTFAAAGTYSVNVTVTDGNGGSVSGSVSVTVTGTGGVVKNARIVKKSFTLNFARGSDSLDVALYHPDFASAVKDGVPVSILIGNQVLDTGNFTRGRAFSQGRFTFSTRSGVMEYAVNNATLQTLLAQYGALNQTGATNITIPIYMQINGILYGGNYSFFYISRAGKAGRGF